MARKKTFPAERRQLLIDYLMERKNASITQISNEFDISEMTVRRYLSGLIEEGVLKKVYGGVVVNDQKIDREPLFNQRIGKNILEKRKIALEAINRIHDGDIVFIESGTTCLEIVKLLNLKRNITAITAAPHILFELINQKNNNGFDGEIICCGGYLRGDPDDIFIGEKAEAFFKNIKVNTAFFGILAINPEDGWMVSSSFEALLINSVVSISSNVIGLADHSKLNRTSLANVGPINLFSEIIISLGSYDESVIEDYRAHIKMTVV